MDWVERLKDSLPDEIARALEACPARWLESCRDLRVRGRGAYIDCADAAHFLPGTEKADMRRLIECLTRGNMHALGECIRQGFIPLPGGFRAGICGRAVMRGGEIAGISDIDGVCIRVCREVNGAAAGVIKHIYNEGRARSTLVLSAPGLGKTTLLRDLAKDLADMGLNVAIADERGEIAPGECAIADVMRLCPKALALPLMVRSMRPDAIITDELGASGDARAVADAIRCGAAVIASAHATGVSEAAARAELGEPIRGGLFERFVVISGPRPGEGIKIFDGRGNSIC